MIPLRKPSDLSPAAYDLYKRAVRSQVHGGRFDLDRNDDLLVAAATEVAEAGLGRLYMSEYAVDLRVAALAKGFSVARDTTPDFAGGLYVEIEVLQAPAARDGILLACLYGARFEQRSESPWPVWRLTVRHATARDADHSASYLADIAIAHPVLRSHDGYDTEFVGTLGEALMWPTDTDITLIDDQSGEPLDEPAMCDSGSCESNPHPYGPFQPNKREDLDRFTGRPVRIKTIPLGLVDENGLRVGTSTITRN